MGHIKVSGISWSSWESKKITQSGQPNPRVNQKSVGQIYKSKVNKLQLNNNSCHQDN